MTKKELIIKIVTPCEEEEEKVLFHLTKFCRENFQNCKIYLNDKLKKEIKWDKHIEEEKKEEKKEFVYPPGHNWEGLTPEQVSEGYKKQKKLKNEKEPGTANQKT